MPRAMHVILLAGSALMLLSLGCGSSGTANIRLVNASPDESNLTLRLNGTDVATGIGYGTASPYESVSSGSDHVQVEPSGSTSSIIDITTDAGPGAYISVLSLNYSYSLSNVVLKDDHSAPASGNFKLRVVNASPSLSVQDVYIQPAGTNIRTSSPTFSRLAFGTASSYSSLPAGNYEIFFTPPGQKVVNVDTGPVALSAGQIRTIMALNASQTYTWIILADLN